MEQINARMLEIELNSKRGYLVPYFKLKDAGLSENSRAPYPHDLKKFLRLVNAGDDDLFITFVQKKVNGRITESPCTPPLYVSRKSPYNEYCIELNLSKDELKSQQIEFEITINMKNTKGYQYAQILFIGMDNKDGIGTVNCFNMEIREEITDAD